MALDDPLVATCAVEIQIRSLKQLEYVHLFITDGVIWPCKSTPSDVHGFLLLKSDGQSNVKQCEGPLKKPIIKQDYVVRRRVWAEGTEVWVVSSPKKGHRLRGNYSSMAGREKVDENSGTVFVDIFFKLAGPKILTCCGSLRFMGLQPLNSTWNSE